MMLQRTVFGRTFTYSHCIGKPTQISGFSQLMDVALAPNGVAYVLGRCEDVLRNTKVTKCILGDDYHQEDMIVQFGDYGTDDGYFMRVTALAIDQDENVYVADEWLNRISIFDKEGDFLGKWGIPGSNPGELCRPWGLVFDKEQHLWMVDSGNNRVQVFTREGKFLFGWGKKGSGEGELDMPWGITLDDEGAVYVADWRNGRAQKFTPTGEYLMSFTAADRTGGQMLHPSGVAVDEEGDVYVVDWANSRVHAYDPDGSYLTTFVGDAQRLTKSAAQQLSVDPESAAARLRVNNLEPEWRLCYPTAVKIDDRRRIVIVDQQRGRLHLYRKEKDFMPLAFNL